MKEAVGGGEGKEAHLGRKHLAVDRVFRSSAVVGTPVNVELGQPVHFVAQGTARDSCNQGQGQSLGHFKVMGRPLRHHDPEEGERQEDGGHGASSSV